MTLEEAKNKLKKEGFVLNKIGKRLLPEKAFIEYEDPDVCEAMQIIKSAGFGIGMELNHFDERKARLKEEREKHSNAPMPTPGSSENRIKEDSGVTPALKESASQFNDALLDEQAKKIEELTKDKENCCSRISDLEYCIKRNNRVYLRGINGLGNEIKRLGKEIARLNKIIHKKNLKIEELKKENSEHLDGKVKYYGETVDLSQELYYKNEELRLTKIREKNLTELGLKYVGENEKLKKELAGANKLVEAVRKGSKEYCEYGIAAEKMIQKMAKEIVNDSPVPSKDYKQYRLWANGYSFNPQLPDFSEEEEKKLSSGRDNHPTEDNPEEIEIEEAIEIIRKAMKEGHTVSIDYDKAEEGGDQSATIVQCDNGITLSKEEAEIIERCTKNGTELHYSEKDGFTYTNVFGEEMPIRCLRGMFHVFTDEEIENMKK